MSVRGLRIDDYAAIGDGRSVALVSVEGSIDWLCWPRFDSPALFGALLDSDRGGRFAITPEVPFKTGRHYERDTNILCTRFTTAIGDIEVVDFMPALDESEKRRALWPEHEILRIVRGLRGTVPIRVEYDPRPDFSLESPRHTRSTPRGVEIETREGLLDLRTPVPMARNTADSFQTRLDVHANDTFDFALTFSRNAPAVIPPLGARTAAVYERTAAFWHAWATRCTYRGPYREAVVRSALALKLLGYAPSGAIVAAPTTSLPERVGGDLNWDYRFCWLRDAAFTARALLGLGYQDDAQAYVSWLLHATRLTQPELRILYDVYGREAPRERELQSLKGYEGSRPVRIGNGARSQLQLDVYGEVIDAVARSCGEGATLDRETIGMLQRVGRYVCHNWHRPDDGIWEPRSGARDHTHSRVLCWTALDRLVAMHDRGDLTVPVELYKAHREAIRRDIEDHAWNPRISSYTQIIGGDEVDAALLLMPWYGFEAADSDRMQLTFARIIDELEAGPSLLYRYRVSGDASEGAFGICCFWAAEFLARGGGSLNDAQRWFERLLDLTNEVGLYGEEFDPLTGAALGNFPQAFTHVGLINAALSIAERAEKESRPSREQLRTADRSERRS